jgi:Protein of unknown function (DUF997)
MDLPHEPAGKEQRLLRHARREGLIIMLVWAAALIWSVGSGYVLGYNRADQPIPLILGMPAWVFWSVVLPWGICLLFSVWFCFVYMADDDLGQDQDEGTAHV